MSRLVTFWTGDLSAGFPTVRDEHDEVGGQPTRKAMIRNIEQLLSAKWGGVTITRVRGMWWATDSTCVKEYGYKFEVYFNEDAMNDSEEHDGDWVKSIADDARYIASVLRQSEVHVTIAPVTFIKVKAPTHD